MEESVGRRRRARLPGIASDNHALWGMHIPIGRRNGLFFIGILPLRNLKRVDLEDPADPQRDLDRRHGFAALEPLVIPQGYVNPISQVLLNELLSLSRFA
jgi:hypothetical protein